MEDKQVPTAICEEYITVMIDDPTTLSSTITPSMIDAGSYDNCGVTVSWVDVTGLTYYGATTASLTVHDGAGNENTCWSTITVESPHYSGGVCAAYGNTYYEHIAYFSWTSPVEDYAVRLTSGWTFGFREDNEIQVNSSRLIVEEIADETDEFGQTIPLTAPSALPSRNETPSAGGTTIYPNPASVGGTVDVALNMAGPLVQSVELNNLVGQPLRRYPATSSNRMSIQLPANLSPGVYLLSGISQNGREWTKKLLVR